MLLDRLPADTRALAHRGVASSTRSLLYDLLKEVDGRVLDEAEELTSVLQQKFADMLLCFLFSLGCIFSMQLVAMNPRNGVVRVQHLCQLAEDILGHIHHELRIDHLAELVGLQIDTARGASHRILVFVKTLHAEVVLRDVRRWVDADPEHPLAVAVTSILQKYRVQPKNCALAESRLEVRAELGTATSVQLLVAKYQLVVQDCTVVEGGLLFEQA